MNYNYDNIKTYFENLNKYSKNSLVLPGVHVMNKNESKVMRRLQAKTGLSKKEIRGVKKYRVMLSEAQKKNQKIFHKNRPVTTIDSNHPMTILLFQLMKENGGYSENIMRNYQSHPLEF